MRGISNFWMEMRVLVFRVVLRMYKKIGKFRQLIRSTDFTRYERRRALAAIYVPQYHLDTFISNFHLEKDVGDSKIPRCSVTSVTWSYVGAMSKGGRSVVVGPLPISPPSPSLALPCPVRWVKLTSARESKRKEGDVTSRLRRIKSERVAWIGALGLRSGTVSGVEWDGGGKESLAGPRLSAGG